MSRATITIKGLDKLQVKLEAIAPAIKRGVLSSTDHIKAKIDKYPPFTAANQPKQYTKGAWNTWYERKWGSKWALKGGVWHGRKTSENLASKWTIKMINRGFTGVVGNNTSYGPYVQGAEEQTEAMKRIGWKDTGTVVEEEKATVEANIKYEIDRELRK